MSPDHEQDPKPEDHSGEIKPATETSEKHADANEAPASADSASKSAVSQPATANEIQRDHDRERLVKRLVKEWQSLLFEAQELAKSMSGAWGKWGWLGVTGSG